MLDDAVRMLPEGSFDLHSIPMDDPEVFEMLSRDEPAACFRCRGIMSDARCSMLSCYWGGREAGGGGVVARWGGRVGWAGKVGRRMESGGEGGGMVEGRRELAGLAGGGVGGGVCVAGVGVRVGGRRGGQLGRDGGGVTSAG